jgi:hypothetical protein
MIMATATFDADLVGNVETTATEPKTGFFRRLLSELIAAREIEARKKVATTLANMPSQNLKELGLSARDIEMLRHGTGLSVELAN